MPLPEHLVNCFLVVPASSPIRKLDEPLSPALIHLGGGLKVSHSWEPKHVLVWIRGTRDWLPVRMRWTGSTTDAELRASTGICHGVNLTTCAPA
jgi:hypothetical protein